VSAVDSDDKNVWLCNE